MFRVTLLASGIALMLAAPAHPADDLASIRAEIERLKQHYEKRIAELEARLQAAEAKADTARQAATAAAAAAPRASFNPDISLILQGQYAHLDKAADPSITGFLTSEGQARPPRGFSVKGTELVLSANVDPLFKGWATLTIADEEVEVEEAWFQTRSLGHGFTLKGGRFLSALGYQNEQHPHAWDFADTNLAYKALFGESYVQDGLQLKWVAPSDLFIEPYVEIGRGAGFPGTDRDKNGAGAVAAGVHVGGDVNVSNSWRAGLGYLTTRADTRPFEGSDANGVGVIGDFSGRSRVWLADFVWKWAPNGNPRERNFKFVAEYFRRNESGTLTCESTDPGSLCFGGLTGPYRSSQSGFYAQGVYQFMPQWRLGYRYDRLSRGDVEFNGADAGATFASLADYDPRRHSLMLDWRPSEFSTLRLQYSQDKSARGQDENQWFVQYLHSLGAHGAHKF